MFQDCIRNITQSFIPSSLLSLEQFQHHLHKLIFNIWFYIIIENELSIIEKMIIILDYWNNAIHLLDYNDYKILVGFTVMIMQDINSLLLYTARFYIIMIV